LAAADSAGLYVPPGWLLFVRQGTLVAQRFDPAREDLTRKRLGLHPNNLHRLMKMLGMKPQLSVRRGLLGGFP
jgi:hypothetical protein